MSELEILFPAPVVVTLNGRSVKILPVKLRNFGKYGKVAGKFIELLDTASIRQINSYASMHSSELQSLLRVTTSLNRWQLWRMPSTVAVLLLVEVIRVNSSFFADALPEMVRALTGPLLPND